MDDNSRRSMSTSTSSTSSRKTSNFFSAFQPRHNSSPLLTTTTFVSAPITPILTSTQSAQSTPNFNELSHSSFESIWNNNFSRSYTKSIPEFFDENATIDDISRVWGTPGQLQGSTSLNSANLNSSAYPFPNSGHSYVPPHSAPQASPYTYQTAPAPLSGPLSGPVSGSGSGGISGTSSGPLSVSNSVSGPSISAPASQSNFGAQSLYQMPLSGQSSTYSSLSTLPLQQNQVSQNYAYSYSSSDAHNVSAHGSFSSTTERSLGADSTPGTSPSEYKYGGFSRGLSIREVPQELTEAKSANTAAEPRRPQVSTKALGSRKPSTEAISPSSKHKASRQSSVYEATHELAQEMTVSLKASSKVKTPTLTIQKFHESFSSTFYKRNKNGYMFIREANDDLIKIDDSTLTLTVNLDARSGSVSVNTNDLKGYELANDFKFIKRKNVQKRFGHR